MITVLSFDPGLVNFAYSVNQHQINDVTRLHDARVRVCGNIRNVVENLKSPDAMHQQILQFRDELDDLDREFGPFDVIGIERYMAQGRMVGLVNEVANLMIGVIIGWAIEKGYPMPLLLMAATWKVAYGVAVESHSTGLKEDYNLCWATPHTLDASLIGYYVACRYFDEQPFRRFSDDMWRDRYLWWVERNCLEKLTKRRRKRMYYSTEVGNNE